VSFTQGSKNYAIFQTTAPYNNPYQGKQPRWLFVCSAGLLRSPTGATMAAQYGINARAAGSSLEYALVPVSANLIRWADKIVFVNCENYNETLENFEDYNILQLEINQKAVVLDVPDNYNYMNPELQQVFKTQLFEKM
jgi:predicted protein tyrosine phosphatase